MSISEASKKLNDTLLNLYEKREAIKISDMIMENITGLSATGRLVNKKNQLTMHQQQQLEDFTRQLLKHKPVQYVLHEAWFYGMKFYVDENVLIPRPETEELVALMLKRSRLKQPRILDIGCGSGCIAISLKKKLPTSIVYALDISEEALDISEKNALANQVNIEVIKADILNTTDNNSLAQFDVIVSNPPYIKKSEASVMNLNVLNFEPHQALFVPDDDPLIFYKAIAEFSLKYLKNKGQLFFEINEALASEVGSVLQTKGFSEVMIKKDLNKKDRIVSASLLRFS
jgi:release factor glutamine methyltransferase